MGVACIRVLTPCTVYTCESINFILAIRYELLLSACVHLGFGTKLLKKLIGDRSVCLNDDIQDPSQNAAGLGRSTSILTSLSGFCGRTTVGVPSRKTEDNEVTPRNACPAVSRRASDCRALVAEPILLA